jgi:hypothetical protein
MDEKTKSVRVLKQMNLEQLEIEKDKAFDYFCLLKLIMEAKKEGVIE